MRVTAEYWKRFVEIAEENPQLITNKFSGSDGKAKLNILWQSVANSLNSLGYGEKSVMEWRKAVTDWKSKTKTKAAKIKQEQTKTGGGSMNIIFLNKIEEELLNLMGEKATDGDIEVTDMGLELPVVQIDPLVSEIVAEAGCSSQNENFISDHCYIDTSKAAGTSKGKVARKRMKKSPAITNDLLQLSRDTCTTLQSIDGNINRLADSAEKITDILERYFVS